MLEPSEVTTDVSDVMTVKAGNMILNRFCIDEDAAFELSGVNYLKEYPKAMWTDRKTEEKGKEYPFWRSYLYLPYLSDIRLKSRRYVGNGFRCYFRYVGLF